MIVSRESNPFRRLSPDIAFVSDSVNPNNVSENQPPCCLSVMEVAANIWNQCAIFSEWVESSSLSRRISDNTLRSLENGTVSTLADFVVGRGNS